MTAQPFHLLLDLGWDDAWTQHANAYEPDLVPGRVVRVDRGLVTVATADGDLRSSHGTDEPCVGDWALLRTADDRVSVDLLLPRRSCVVRAHPSGTSYAQALAANVTLAAVVVGLDQEPAITKVERLVAIAWESGAVPLVVLTKTDLAPDAADVADDVALAAPGVDVLCCSTVDGSGIDALREQLGDGTMAMLGSSGVGKSSLVNALAGADVLATAQIRSDGRGRHTSVRRELVVLPGGGCVIDTPGLRGVGLSGGEGLAATFSDIDGLAASCRFADCSHDGEPGCGVLAAVEDGSLPPRRLDSWRKLQREAAYVARRTDARLRAAESRVWKQRTKTARAARRQR